MEKYAKKLKVQASYGVLNPSVVRVPLCEADYQAMLEWQGELELYAVCEACGKEYPAQLFAYGMKATPEAVEKDLALYILVDDAWDGEVELALIKKEAEEVIPKDRNRYSRWKFTKGIVIEPQPERARVMVIIDGGEFTRFYHSKDMPKPYYYPLYGPQNKSLIQDGPDDHIHHHGLWWGHDDVNGHPIYHEFSGEGRQQFKEFLVMEGGPVVGQLTAVIEWFSRDGERQLTETRTVRFYNLPPEARYMDMCTQIHTTDGEIVFGTTKEGGFPFIRVNEQICGNLGGKLTSSAGKHGEEEIFCTEGDWVDYSGTIGKEEVKAGITFMLHPTSYDYPTKWFVRNAGAVTPSNFHFCGGYTLPDGEMYMFCQRLFIHEGFCEDANLDARYQEYAGKAEGQLI